MLLRGHYVGIHATGFRDFVLKPEIIRSIVDCGFEHPSEGAKKQRALRFVEKPRVGNSPIMV